MRNKLLYCLREAFHWARDLKEALPARKSTICDWVEGKKPTAVTYEPYSAEDTERIASHLVDQDMVWGFLLNGQHFVRQEEAVKLCRRHFHRDETGTPDTITITEDISKTETEREVPIEPQFRELFKVLLDGIKGDDFVLSRNPFGRIDNLTRVLDIPKQKNGLRRSCISHAVGAGMSKDRAAQLAGHSEDTQKLYLTPVDHEEGKQYRSITFDLEAVRRMRRYQKVNFEKLAGRTKAKVPSTSTIEQQQLLIPDISPDPQDINKANGTTNQ